MPDVSDIEQLQENYRVTVNAEYLDNYGHMNVRWYSELWGFAAYGLMKELGFGKSYMEEYNYGTWVLRQVIDYLAEVHEGDTLSMRGRILHRTPKLLHNKYWMLNETKQKIAASSEVLVGHADLSLRRLVPFPDTVASNLDARIAETNLLGWEASVSGAITI